MGRLKKRSEEVTGIELKPVSFRLDAETLFKLRATAKALDKSNSRVIQDLIEIGYGDVLNAHPNDLKKAEVAVRREEAKTAKNKVK